MSPQAAFSEVAEIVSGAIPLGRRVQDDGTQLIGHVPHVAPMAYHHILFGPLSDVAIGEVRESLLPIPLAPDYVKWLRWANGASFFSGALSLYGYSRLVSRDPSRVLPFGIVVPNTLERPAGAQGTDLFFGSYQRDGSKLLVRDDSSVARCPRSDGSLILNEWTDFFTMLTSELRRLSSLFDSEGRLLAERSMLLPD